AINGFDSFGHYLRAGLILNTCSQYSITASSDCLATFGGASARGARAASLKSPTPTWKDTRRDPTLRAIDALLHGVNPATASPAATRDVSQPATRQGS